MTAPALPASEPRFPGSRTITPNKSIEVDLPDWDEDRYRLIVSAEDQARIGRGRPWTAIVTDLPSGQRFELADDDCGAGPHCRCAAKIVRQLP